MSALRVEVVPTHGGQVVGDLTNIGPASEPTGYTLWVRDALLPVEYRSRAEALRAADRVCEVLADGFQRWCETHPGSRA